MRLERFPKLAINVIKKDWAEYKKPIALINIAVLAAIIFDAYLTPDRIDFSRGVVAGIVIGGAAGFAQFCFHNERQRGTIYVLLGLPVHPIDVVLLKYVSLYSMVLFNVNLPAVLIGDISFLLTANAAALFLSTLCMAATVISDKPWAPQLPMWALLFISIPLLMLSRAYPAIPAFFRTLISQPALIAAVIAITIPSLICVSAIVFSRQVSQ